MTQKVLTPDEVAEILAVTPKAVRGWLKDGKMPGFRLGRLWRIREKDLDQFINGSGFTSGKGPPQKRSKRSAAPTRTKKKKTPQKRSTGR